MKAGYKVSGHACLGRHYRPVSVSGSVSSQVKIRAEKKKRHPED